MDINIASRIFATLGHPGRLAVYRLLMRFAPHGVRPTEIAEALAMKQNTLSHHLSDLASSGLVQVKRDGRSLFYSVDMAQTEALVAYLALNVGRARPELLSPFPAAVQENDVQDSGFNVLFICSGNSARSIFAEAILRDLGRGRFIAFSAGTRPNSTLNPFALEVLERNGHATGDMRSKHISEFQALDSPVMDFVFTVCDAAAAEECPPWPGQPITGHWGLPDPVKATGTEAEKGLVFAQTYSALRRRIAAFIELPFAELNRISLQSRVDAIGTDVPEQKG
jgi:protein-tyrosine-phosphatase/DNA-binding transcriptional ArsR family regulator